jgi:hypothetical protein
MEGYLTYSPKLVTAENMIPVTVNTVPAMLATLREIWASPSLLPIAEKTLPTMAKNVASTTSMGLTKAQSFNCLQPAPLRQRQHPVTTITTSDAILHQS